jgi:hypothetical protein
LRDRSAPQIDAAGIDSGDLPEAFIQGALCEMSRNPAINTIAAR